MKVDKNNKQAKLKNCQPLADSITEINNTQADNAKDLNIVMEMYNLIERSDNYFKKFVSLYRFCRDELKNAVTDSESFKR